jgi:hypothetical protein
VLARPSDLSPNHNSRKARIATGITRLCELTEVPKVHIVRFRLGTTRDGSGSPATATEAPLNRGFFAARHNLKSAPIRFSGWHGV